MAFTKVYPQDISKNFLSQGQNYFKKMVTDLLKIPNNEELHAQKLEFLVNNIKIIILRKFKVIIVESFLLLNDFTFACGDFPFETLISTLK